MPLPSGPLPPLPALSFCRMETVRPREDSDSCKIKASCGPAEPGSLDSKGTITSPLDPLPIVFLALLLVSLFLFLYSLPAFSPQVFSLSFSYSFSSSFISFCAFLPPTLLSSLSLPCVSGPNRFISVRSVVPWIGHRLLWKGIVCTPRKE